MRDPSNFRLWLEKIWQEHQDEIFEYSGKKPDYSRELYIRKYKWWLKSLYKRQHHNDRTS